MEAGFEIILIVNLINMDGERDENNTDVTCKLERSVTVKEGKSSQADFICELTGLDKEIEYYSLRLNSSKFVAGIPEDDETLLNPKLTEKAITDKEKSAHPQVVTTSRKYIVTENNGTVYDTSDGDFLSVHNDIFKPENWEIVSP